MVMSALISIGLFVNSGCVLWHWLPLFKRPQVLKLNIVQKVECDWIGDNYNTRNQGIFFFCTPFQENLGELLSSELHSGIFITSPPCWMELPFRSTYTPNNSCRCCDMKWLLAFQYLFWLFRLLTHELRFRRRTSVKTFCLLWISVCLHSPWKLTGCFYEVRVKGIVWDYHSMKGGGGVFGRRVTRWQVQARPFHYEDPLNISTVELVLQKQSG